MGRVDLKDIQSVLLHTGVISNDHRGSFMKFFEREEYRIGGFDPSFNTLAITSNVDAGTLRGLHFQGPPFEEEKLIMCLQGSIFDVVVDLRRDSQTLGKWAAIELNDSESATLYLPKGVAHGYQTLTPETKIFYGLTSEYSLSSAHSLNYADPDLAIKWPMPMTQISVRDSAGIALHEAINLATDSTD